MKQLHSGKQMGKNNRLTVALDVGTTQSGYVFSRNSKDGKSKIHTYQWRNGEGVESAKVPSAVLFYPDMTFHSFGYKAIQTFTELCKNGQSDGWHFVRKFKLALFDNKVCYEKDAVELLYTYQTSVGIIILKLSNMLLFFLLFSDKQLFCSLVLVCVHLSLKILSLYALTSLGVYYVCSILYKLI